MHQEHSSRSLLAICLSFMIVGLHAIPASAQRPSMQDLVEEANRKQIERQRERDRSQQMNQDDSLPRRNVADRQQFEAKNQEMKRQPDNAKGDVPAVLFGRLQAAANRMNNDLSRFEVLGIRLSGDFTQSKKLLAREFPPKTLTSDEQEAANSLLRGARERALRAGQVVPKEQLKVDRTIDQLHCDSAKNSIGQESCYASRTDRAADGSKGSTKIAVLAGVDGQIYFLGYEQEMKAAMSQTACMTAAKDVLETLRARFGVPTSEWTGEFETQGTWGAAYSKRAWNPSGNYQIETRVRDMAESTWPYEPLRREYREQWKESDVGSNDWRENFAAFSSDYAAARVRCFREGVLRLEITATSSSLDARQVKKALASSAATKPRF